VTKHCEVAVPQEACCNLRECDQRTPYDRENLGLIPQLAADIRNCHWPIIRSYTHAPDGEVVVRDLRVARSVLDRQSVS